MLIQNYGLFWLRNDVFWGKPNNRGHLKGYYTKSQSRVADFRDQQGVYCLYDETFKLIYVGQAGANDQQRLFDRLNQHTNDALADRWNRFSWFGIRWVTKKNKLAAEAQNQNSTAGSVLNHIEAILIASAEPPHNRQFGRFGEDVEQYRQWRDIGQLGPTTDDMVRVIWKAQISN